MWTIVFLLLLTLFYVTYIRMVQQLMSKIHFLSREETIQFFRSDPDGYTDSLTPYDLKALGFDNKIEYIDKSCEDAIDFTLSQKEYVTTCCREADVFFMSQLQNRFPYINGEVLATMDWNISLTKGEIYEEGYPHTRMNIIFITPDVINRGCTRILIHEKVHVYERLFPSHVEKWMKEMGYKPYKRSNEYRLRRSNPDLDGWVYKDDKGRETIALFKSEQPTGIDDSIYLGGSDWKFEHPYETLAYRIDYFYANETFT